MRRQDLRRGTRIKNGGVVFVVWQANLFLRPSGQVMGGAVFPERAKPGRLVRGYDATAILHNGQLSTMALTVS